MPLEYEDGYTPLPHSLEMHRLKTKEFLKPLIGKVVKDIKYAEDYGYIIVIFDDETELDIMGDECFDFHVEITPGKE
jgi:hypothetical protein